MTHRMLFNTGVQAYNRRDKHGKLITLKHDVWIDGILFIEYFLEYAPPENARLLHLAQEKLDDFTLAIPIVSGGMSSKFAIFSVL